MHNLGSFGTLTEEIRRDQWHESRNAPRTALTESDPWVHMQVMHRVTLGARARRNAIGCLNGAEVKAERRLR